MALFTKLMSGDEAACQHRRLSGVLWCTGSEQEGLAGSVALQMQGFGRTLGPLIAGAALDHGGLKVRE